MAGSATQLGGGGGRASPKVLENDAIKKDTSQATSKQRRIYKVKRQNDLLMLRTLSGNVIIPHPSL